MKKLKDIRKNLSQDLDIQEQYPLGDISVKKDTSTKGTTHEFGHDLQDIHMQKSRDIHLQKNKTKFFDSLGYKTLLFSDTIDISKNTFFSKMKNMFGVKVGWFHFVGGLFFLFLLLYIDKSIVENKVQSAYKKLSYISQEKTDIDATKKIINDVRFDFLFSDILFTPFKMIPGDQISNGYHAIKGGKRLTKSIDTFFQLYDKTLAFVNEKSIENIYFTQLFQNIEGEFIAIEDNLTATLFHYNSIKNISNAIVEEQLSDNIERLSFFLSRVKVINDNFSTFLDILGHSGRKQYLIVFQNSDEIRPTGGFMGSMALVSMFRGQIKKFEPRDVYSFEWDLKRADYNRVSPPRGIDILTSSFGLRDGNYYINPKDSSDTIKFFIEQSGQEIDGIIYINQNILEDLLDVTGDIYFEPIDTSVSGENFSKVMSLLVESKVFKEGVQGTPKQILFDFMDVFFQELITQKKYSSYLQVFIDHLQKREIMIYAFDREENKLLQELGLGGLISYDATLDYSYPVYTSLSGNKSDRYMSRSYKKEISYNDDCSINTSFSITSRHGFNKKEKTYVNNLINRYKIEKSQDTLVIQGDGDNYQFVRVLLPPESVIEQQENMKVVNYGKRKGVEFYIRTRPTETTYYTFQYSLENKDCQEYDYTFYKQPGIRDYDIEITSPKRQESFSGLQTDFFYSEDR